MYYPIIRTKQFDLLALQMLLKKELLHEKIVPILEPVKDSLALQKTVALLEKSQHLFYVVENPQVGNYPQIEKKMYPLLVPPQNQAYYQQDSLVLGRENSLQLTSQLFPDNPRQIFLQDVMNFESLGEDEFFSDSHKFFAADGFLGFSDYSISGGTYFEKGYPSQKVTLHVVYLDPFNSLRIKHFVSTNQVGYDKIPEKFLEAGEKLKIWLEKYEEVTYVSPFLKDLVSLVERQHFPGLGVIKKNLLAHHFATLTIFFNQKKARTIHKF